MLQWSEVQILNCWESQAETLSLGLSSDVALRRSHLGNSPIHSCANIEILTSENLLKVPSLFFWRSSVLLLARKSTGRILLAAPILLNHFFCGRARFLYFSAFLKFSFWLVFKIFILFFDWIFGSWNSFYKTRHVIWCPHDDPRTALIFSKIKLTLEDLGFQRRMGDLEISRM